MKTPGTFNGGAKEFGVVHRDEGVTEERAEEIEEGNDTVGVLQGHGRTSRQHLQQRNHGAAAQGEGERRRSEGGEKSEWFTLPHSCATYSTQRGVHIGDDILSSPCDHLCCHGADQVPEMSEEAGVEGQTVQ